MESLCQRSFRSFLKYRTIVLYLFLPFHPCRVQLFIDLLFFFICICPLGAHFCDNYSMSVSLPFSIQSRILHHLIYTMYISRDFHSFILSPFQSFILILFYLFLFLLGLFLFYPQREQPSHLPCVFFIACVFLCSKPLSKKTQPLFLSHSPVRIFILVSSFL